MKTHEPVMTGTKTCNKCSRELPVICFAVNKTTRDGLHNECRDCAKTRTKEIYKKNRHTKNITGSEGLRTTLLRMKYEPEGISIKKRKD